MSDERLYGVPYAEHMYFDLADAYEAQIDPFADEAEVRPTKIEEWTTCPAGSSLPTADTIIEYAYERAWDDVTEDMAETIANTGEHPEVVAAFTAALDLWASKITYRMADKFVRAYEITWDAAGEPLADGEPIYRKVTTDD